MPMTTQVEEWDFVVHEWKTMIDGHYDELSLHKARGIPLDPAFEVYDAINRRGELLFVSLRDAGKLVGYFIGFIQLNLHYRTCLTCTMDIYYVHPSHRGKHGGIRLMRAVRKELARRGVKCWMNGSKLHKDSGRLFTALGMKPVETYYSLWL